MVITVASFKGGIAKTTTALHLAAYFQIKGTAADEEREMSESVEKLIEQWLKFRKPDLDV